MSKTCKNTGKNAEKISEKILEIVRNSGLSLSELENLTGIDRARMSRIRSGHQELSAKNIDAIGKAFGVTVVRVE